MVTVKQLKDIANVLRRDSAILTTEAGSGHPTSCFSCAELMSVLFFDEMRYDVNKADNENNDEFILSKGHAAPILYSSLFRSGCIKKLDKLRDLHSKLEGHPMPRSLDWIKVATGSLGQGLSVGLGFALAAKLKKKDFRSYVLMGDSEIAEGSIYEALQLASYYNLNNLVGIVDANRLGQTGKTMIGHDVEIYKKRFESFGWKALIVDGHNINQIKRAFSSLRKSNRPGVIIAKTFKGKGVSFLENKEDWHGKALSESQLEDALKEIKGEMSKINIKKPKIGKFKFIKIKPIFKDYDMNIEIATRESYGDTLASLAIADSSVLALDAEVSNSTKSDKVKEESENQFIETFIAEQNLIGISLGLSKKGFNVFASTFAAFLSRAHDQIRMSALSNADFTICGSHVGVSIGEDGGSQMGLGDISLFRNLPNSVVLYPSDAVSCQKLTKLAGKLKGITYVRTTRPENDVIYDNKVEFKLGDFKVLRQSKKDKAVLVGSGVTLHEALKAYDKIGGVAVVDLYCVKPFNLKKFEKFVQKHGKRVIIGEDHYEEGGIGEMLSKGDYKLEHLAVREIPHSGEEEELMEKYGINSDAYVKKV